MTRENTLSKIRLERPPLSRPPVPGHPAPLPRLQPARHHYYITPIQNHVQLVNFPQPTQVDGGHADRAYQHQQVRRSATPSPGGRLLAVATFSAFSAFSDVLVPTTGRSTTPAETIGDRSERRQRRVAARPRDGDLPGAPGTAAVARRRRTVERQAGFWGGYGLVCFCWTQTKTWDLGRPCSITRLCALL